MSGGERDTQFAGLIQRNLDSKAHYDAGVEQVITGTEHIYPGYQESADIISILHLEKAFKDHRIFEPMLLELIRDLYVMEVSKPTMGDSVDFSLGFQDTYRYILLATEMAGDLPFFIKILKVVLTMEKYTVDYTVDTTLLPKVFPLS